MARRRHRTMSPRRGTRRPEPRKRFLIVTEGSSTEVAYFNDCRRLFRGRAKLVVSHDASSPNKVVAEAVRLKTQDAAAARAARDADDVYDEVWCVLDVDSHATLSSALEEAAREGISVAVSNPCFEVWLILHADDQRAALSSSRIAKERWRSTAREHALDPAAFEAFLVNLPEALRRADDLDEMHHRNDVPRLRRNPSTEVHLLLRQLERQSGIDLATAI